MCSYGLTITSCEHEKMRDGRMAAESFPPSSANVQPKKYWMTLAMLVSKTVGSR